MANGADSHETPDARTVDAEQLMAAMSGLTQGQIEDVLRKIESAVHSAAKRHSGFLDRRLTLA